MDSLCQRIVQEERQQGHNQVASELEKILSAPGPPKPTGPAKPLSALPTSRREAAPLVHHLRHETLRHEIILPEAVEDRLRRIEAEHAARNRLAHFGLRPRCRILLYGPPGCGKSLAAERLAWATALDLKKVRFDTLISSFFGETASNLARIFEDAAGNLFALFLVDCETVAKCRAQAQRKLQLAAIANGTRVAGSNGRATLTQYRRGRCDPGAVELKQRASNEPEKAAGSVRGQRFSVVRTAGVGVGLARRAGRCRV